MGGKRAPAELLFFFFFLLDLEDYFLAITPVLAEAGAWIRSGNLTGSCSSSEEELHTSSAVDSAPSIEEGQKTEAER